jgi:beta-lactamase superfamily II metal-dependent hydrolase
MARRHFAAIPFALWLAAPLPAAARDNALQMVAIDVEGGGGTLFVTPEGKSLLIDTGNPEASRLTGNHPSSERIAAAAHALGVHKIDYLLITHYHGDHIGGLEGLLARIPIGTIIDHGPNRETTASTRPDAPQIDVNNPPPGSSAYGYRHYLALIGKRRHIVAHPGQQFHIGGMTVTIVMADARPIARPLPGAGESNPSCAGMPDMAANGGEENARSTSSVISYGKARIVAFGDLTWNREKDLFCPLDRVGKVNVYLASHHSIQFSGSPAMVNALAPVVAILGNGPRKGDNPERVKTIEHSPRIRGIWRLHKSAVNPQIDGDPDMIANLQTTPEADKAYNLRLRIRKDGQVTVINERNGYNKSYQAP